APGSILNFKRTIPEEVAVRRPQQSTIKRVCMMATGLVGSTLIGVACLASGTPRESAISGLESENGQVDSAQDALRHDRGVLPGDPLYAANGAEAWRFEGADFTPQPPVQALSPAEEQQKFLLPAGYRMEAILTEPSIE